MKVIDSNVSKEANILAEVSGVYLTGSYVLPSNISSSSNQLLITFTSDELYVSSGFMAKIHIESSLKANLSADACSMTSPCKDKEGHCQSDDECQGYLKCGHFNCPAGLGYHPKTRCCYDYCSNWLNMEEGYLASPWYPKNHPTDFKCRTLITVGMTVAGPRTITLEFLHFKVSNDAVCEHFYMIISP